MAENQNENLELETNEEVPAGGDLRVALRQEREKRQAAQKEAKDAKEALDKAKPLADEYSQILPYLPYLINQSKSGGKATNTEVENQDSEAVEYARIMGYEKDDGSPDVDKARKALDFHDRRTGAKVAKETGKVAKQTASLGAQHVRERAYKVVDSDGRLYAKKEFIDKVFSEIPPDVLSNPDNAVAALIMARGLGGPGDESEKEPVFTESVGRVKKAPKAMTPLGKSIASIRGRSDDEWLKQQDDPEVTGWDLE
jgi:hypothetical protein